MSDDQRKPTETMKTADTGPGSTGLLARFALPIAFVAGALLLFLHAYVLDPGKLNPRDNPLGDDSYITFRYAENLAQGHGFRYNAGGERVEGFTSFLWLVILAGVRWLGLDVVRVGQGLSMLCALLTLAMVLKWLSEIKNEVVFLLTGALLLESMGAYVFWATEALETHLFAGLIVSASYVALANPLTRRRAVLLGVLLVLCGMARPEGALVAAVLFGALLLAHRSDRAILAIVARAVAVFGVLGGAYFLWRLSYFHFLLPNTFYAKVGSNPRQVFTGIRHVFEFTKQYGQLVPFFVLVALAAPRTHAIHTLGALAGTYLLYLVAIGGGPWMDHHFRYVVPVWPILVIVLVQAFERVRTAFGEASSSGVWAQGRAALYLAFLGSAAFWIMEPSMTGAGTRIAAARSPEYNESEAWTAVARELREQAPPGATLAISAAGKLPYLAKLDVIDMLGLNDITIAHLPCPAMGVAGERGHERSFPDEILRRKPTYVVLDTRLTPEPEEVGDWSRGIPIVHDLSIDPALHRDYVFKSIKGENRYFNFYERKPAASALQP